MSRSPRWFSPLAALAVTAIVFSACAGNASPSPSAPSGAPSQSAAASPSGPPFAGTSYPDTAVDCASKPAGYTGTFSQIKAIDALTVEFDLCSPDAAFLSKIAFTSNNILDTAWIEAHGKDKSIVTQTNGTGPYMVKEWVKGDHITLVANPNYWGEKPKAQTAIIRWSTESAQRLQELTAGTVDGIDNVGPDDFPTVQANSDFKLFPRDALNILYLGFNVDDPPWNNEKVRQALAMGLDRQRIADNFYPPGSEAAKYFTPCAIPGACGGTAWPDLDKTAAKQLLKDANFDFSKTYDFHYRTKSRSYVANPTQVATDLQAQLQENLGIKVKLVVEKDDTFITDQEAGKFPLFLLGWGADYPDVTDFLDIHFGTGSVGFGKHFDDITALLTQGASTVDANQRATIYGQANDLIRQHVPLVPLVHGASATAFKADVAGAHSSAINNEALWTMTPGDRSQIVWLQNSEPSGLYCGDESDGDALRICTQIFDSLYNYKVAGLDVEPGLATSCEPNTDGKVWTCHLREGVKFADGAAFDANDVVQSYAIQWDAKNQYHVGNSGTFYYFPTLFGGMLNPPPPS